MSPISQDVTTSSSTIYQAGKRIRLARVEPGERAPTPVVADRWSRAMADRLTHLTTISR